MDIVTDLRSENYKGQQNCISFSGTNVVKWLELPEEGSKVKV